MKILDTTNGCIHEYGSSPHDSLEISDDGCALHYYNLQCGDGSEFGSYRFVMEDGKIPEESQTEDARYAECYFNIGGFDKRPHGEWIPITNCDGRIFAYKCNICGWFKQHDIMPFCENCGASMKEGDPE